MTDSTKPLPLASSSASANSPAATVALLSSDPYNSLSRAELEAKCAALEAAESQAALRAATAEARVAELEIVLSNNPGQKLALSEVEEQDIEKEIARLMKTLPKLTGEAMSSSALKAFNEFDAPFQKGIQGLREAEAMGGSSGV